MEDKLHFPSSVESASSHPEASFELKTGGFCRGVCFFFASAYILLNLGKFSPQRVWELNSLIPKKGLSSSFLCAPEIDLSSLLADVVSSPRLLHLQMYLISHL